MLEFTTNRGTRSSLVFFPYVSTSKLQVRVYPNSTTNQVKLEMNSDGQQLVKVYVKAPAVDGQANRAVVAILAKYLHLPETALTITHGLKSKNKTIVVQRHRSK